LWLLVGLERNHACCIQVAEMSEYPDVVSYDYLDAVRVGLRLLKIPAKVLNPGCF
jgi:hypothetical protein